MKPGDLVKWIGFSSDTGNPTTAEIFSMGLVIGIWKSAYNENDERIDVLWDSGKIGRGLYPQTVEVISENR